VFHVDAGFVFVLGVEYLVRFDVRLLASGEDLGMEDVLILLRILSGYDE